MSFLISALRFRLWWLVPTAVLAGVGEIIGWSGRLWSSFDILTGTPFLMQYVYHMPETRRQFTYTLTAQRCYVYHCADTVSRRYLYHLRQDNRDARHVLQPLDSSLMYGSPASEYLFVSLTRKWRARFSHLLEFCTLMILFIVIQTDMIFILGYRGTGYSGYRRRDGCLRCYNICSELGAMKH